MSADNKTPPPDPRLAWASERLGTAPAGRSGDFTVGLLRRVEEEDFVPPPIVRQAWEVAMGKAAADPAPLDELLEENQRAEIEAFASRFFEIAPADRNRTWRRLANEAARWPRLKVRLESLQPGLNVEFPEISAHKPEVRQLLGTVKESFTLPPDRRALRRREMLRGPLLADPRRWQSAARHIRWRYRSIAALSPDLIVQLATLRKATKQAAYNRVRREMPSVFSTKIRVEKLANMRVWLVAIVSMTATLFLLDALINGHHPSTTFESQHFSSPSFKWTPPVVPDPQSYTEKHTPENIERAFRFMKERSYLPSQPQNSDTPMPPIPAVPATTIPPQTSGNLTDQGAKAAIELLIKRGLLRPKQAPVDPADPAQNSDASAKPSTIPAEAVPSPVSSGPQP